MTESQEDRLSRVLDLSAIALNNMEEKYYLEKKALSVGRNLELKELRDAWQKKYNEAVADIKLALIYSNQSKKAKELRAKYGIDK